MNRTKFRDLEMTRFSKYKVALQYADPYIHYLTAKGSIHDASKGFLTDLDRQPKGSGDCIKRAYDRRDRNCNSNLPWPLFNTQRIALGYRNISDNLAVPNSGPTELQMISELHRFYHGFQYVILFPFGDYG